MPNLSDALTSGAGVLALVSAWLGYLIWLRQRIIESRLARDASLRDQRLAAYRALWRNLELLALYAPPLDVTVGRLMQLQARLRRWYFRHGILLSTRARDVFFLLQESLDLVRGPNAWASTVTECTPGSGPTQPNPPGEQQRTTDWIVRPRTWVIPQTPMDDWFKRMDFVPLDAKSLRKPILFAAWCRATKRVVREWKFGEPVATVPTPDFLLLQFLSSQLRTVLTADLNSRSTAVVDRDSV